MVRSLLVAFAALALILGGACADGGDGTVAVTLTEFEIEAEPSSVEAGEVTFEVSNDGDETHEFVLVSTDLAPDALPKSDDGSFDEEGLDVVDEIEDIEAGDSEELTVDLDAGSYVLACNVVEEEEGGETEAHYSEGMHTSFEVS